MINKLALLPNFALLLVTTVVWSVFLVDVISSAGCWKRRDAFWSGHFEDVEGLAGDIRDVLYVTSHFEDRWGKLKQLSTLLNRLETPYRSAELYFESLCVSGCVCVYLQYVCMCVCVCVWMC